MAAFYRNNEANINSLIDKEIKVQQHDNIDSIHCQTDAKLIERLKKVGINSQLSYFKHS